MILKGNILITIDKNIIYQTINTMPDIKIINLAEDNELNIDPRYYISGTILLPPIDALIAEVDGDEAKYDRIYYNHLISPIVQEYVSSIIAFLYKGGRLLLYFPNEEYNNTMIKLLNFIMIIYGIHIGILGDIDYNNSSCYFDSDKEWYQLDLMYIYTGIIDWREYLYLYPLNLPINEIVLDLLMRQIKPYGDTYEQRLNVIQRLRVGIKEKPNLTNPIMWRC